MFTTTTCIASGLVCNDCLISAPPFVVILILFQICLGISSCQRVEYETDLVTGVEVKADIKFHFHL